MTRPRVMRVTELRGRRNTLAHVNIIYARRRIMFVVWCARDALKYLAASACALAPPDRRPATADAPGHPRSARRQRTCRSPRRSELRQLDSAAPVRRLFVAQDPREESDRPS